MSTPNNTMMGEHPNANSTAREYQQSVIEVSDDSINSIEKVEEWKVLANGNGTAHMHNNNNSKRNIPNGTPSPKHNGNAVIVYFIINCFST